MIPYKRVFLVGHPGAGKALLAKELAEQLGWKYIDADLGLENRIGVNIHTILAQGSSSFYQCQYEIIEKICKQDNVVVTTDPSIVCSDKLCHLLASEFTVYIEVSLSSQMGRTSTQANFLLSKLDRKTFFETLHHERDALYQQISSLQINSDDNALEQHVNRIAKAILDNNNEKQAISLDTRELIFFHKIHHTPVQLGLQQAICLKYLAQGQSAKEIAREMKISYRTVEGTLAKVMELLGCTSSKELITLYHTKP